MIKLLANNYVFFVCVYVNKGVLNLDMTGFFTLCDYICGEGMLCISLLILW